MNDGLQGKLFVNFPLLYKHKPEIECLDGWFNIIYELSEKIELLIADWIKSHADNPYIPCAVEVRESWGGLYYNIEFITDEIQTLINETEILSEEICENCGKLSCFKRHLFGHRRNICLNCFMLIKKEYDGTN